jgi:hypothetical protein
MPLQRQKHISQKVGTVVTGPLPGLPAARAASPAGSMATAAPAAADIDEICRKRRRETAGRSFICHTL